MCVLTIKKDKQLMPILAKLYIIVLGNCEKNNWSKSNRFAPVRWFDSLRSLVSLSTQHHRGLKQRDCKTTFCQVYLPPEETTIIQPPSGNQIPARMNIGFFSKFYMAFIGAPINGTRKLTKFFDQLVSSSAHRILACTLASSVIQRMPLGPLNLSLCCWACMCMWTTLSSSQNIQQSKHYLNVY